MTNVNKIPFLCQRIKELREKNGYTMDVMAKKLDELEGTRGTNKSSVSRVEGGKTSERTLLEMTKKYCKIFGMSEAQTKQFLRGDKIAIPDTSALLRNPNLIDELNKEYSKVVIPKIVIDELDNIKNNHTGKYSAVLSKKAWEILRGISYGERTLCRDSNNSCLGSNGDCKIIQIAQETLDEHCCRIDIITEDIDYSAYLKGHEMVSALYLKEYMATHQGIINMEKYKRIRQYYADSYDNAEVPDLEEVNAYDENGNTLLISCIRNTKIPLRQRKAKIKWLIANGADVNKRDCGGKYLPALSHTIQMKGQYEMFEFLLDECDADPNAGSRNPHSSEKVRQKNEGNMPLMIAAWSGKDAFVRKLCGHERISINQQDANGFTALIKACANGNTGCRDILLKAGADTRIVDINGKNYEDHYNNFLTFGPLVKRFQNKKFGRRS